MDNNEINENSNNFGKLFRLQNGSKASKRNEKENYRNADINFIQFPISYNVK